MCGGAVWNMPIACGPGKPGMKPGIAPPWAFIMPIVGGSIGGALIVICAICAVTLPAIAGVAETTGVGGAGGLQFCVAASVLLVRL